MPARHSEVRARRRVPALWSLITVTVLGAAGVYVGHVGAGGTRASNPAAASQGHRTCVPSAAEILVSCGGQSATVLRASPALDPGTAPQAAKRSSGQNGRAQAHTPTPPSQPPSALPSPPPSAPPSPEPSASAPPGAHAVSRVLALINKARARAGLPAYTISAGLDRSAAAHNALMADGCGLSHQCPGEPDLGTRESDAGVQWTTVGENIADGGPEPLTAAAVARMAVNLTQDMLNEKPPDDGHRQNILSSAFHHIGIAVQQDASGTVWMTQDFSN